MISDKEIKAHLGMVASKVAHRKDGTWVVKRMFFYRHGGSAEGLAGKVENAMKGIGLQVRVLLAEEHWNAWPRDSWWQVEFEIG